MGKKNILTRAKKAKVEDLVNGNQLAEARALCAQICTLDKADTQAWALLGLIERRLGRYADAEAAARHAVTLRPTYAWAHHVLGTVLQCQNRHIDALESFRSAARLQPDNAETHYLLGNSLKELCAYTDADASYARALELQPDLLQALSNRGAVLIALGRVGLAEQCLQRANALHPGLPQVLCNIALLHNAQGHYEEALGYCQEALHCQPDFLDAITLSADLYEKNNNIAAAKHWVDRGLALDVDHPSLHMTLARIARREGRTDEAIERLESLRAVLPEAAQHDTLLLLGQLYDKKKDTHRAFQYLVDGNRLKAQAMLSSVEESERYLQHIEDMRARFRAESATAWQLFPDDDFTDNPIFLFGFPRSGTTLLEQVLDSHPGLQAIPEKPTVAAVARALGDRSLAALTLADINALRKVFFEAVARYVQRQPGLLVVDKMPLNTVEVQLIWRLFPNAKCILAIRHPCDACFSCFMQNFVINNAMSTFFTLEKTAQAYSNVMSLWQEYIDVLPVNYHRIRYEDLVTDPMGETQRLLDFLGLGWDEAVLRHHEHARNRRISTPSYHQVTQPIYQDAKYRWQRYADYLQPILPVLQPYIDYFGYGASTSDL